MTILVTGGRGGVARAVVDELQAAGHPVRVASRDPGAAGSTVRVPVVAADPARPQTLAAAFEDVTAVFLYADPEGVQGYLEAARAAKVERIVLLSSSSVGRDDTSSPIAQRHLVVERAIAASDIAWTFVRPGAFATNALQWAPSIRAEDTVRGAFPDASSAPIHERDMAAVAVRALLEPGHEGAIHTLTGPQSLTRRQQAELIGTAIGRPVHFVELTRDQAREQMIEEMGAAAFPALVDTLLDYLAANDGVPTTVRDTVAKVTGRPARTFAEWAADHAAAFRG